MSGELCATASSGARLLSALSPRRARARAARGARARAALNLILTIIRLLLLRAPPRPRAPRRPHAAQREEGPPHASRPARPAPVPPPPRCPRGRANHPKRACLRLLAVPHERLSRAFDEAAFGHVHPWYIEQVARHRARLAPRAIHHHQRHSLLLRGHPRSIRARWLAPLSREQQQRRAAPRRQQRLNRVHRRAAALEHERQELRGVLGAAPFLVVDGERDVDAVRRHARQRCQPAADTLRVLQPTAGAAALRAPALELVLRLEHLERAYWRGYSYPARWQECECDL
eukprot:scaffold58158_cov61-Phaeocystis_antarctica.AAC.5